VVASIQMRWVIRYLVIWLAKLVLWVLQDIRVASAWLLYDNHMCGTVATSTDKKKIKKSKK
jgi:hypothetical protein